MSIMQIKKRIISRKNKTSKATFRKAIKEQNVESLCHRVKSTSGDSVLVESGRIHARLMQET